MPKGKKLLPDTKEEQGPLARVIRLAPLLTIILKILELTLKVLRIIK